MYALVAALVVGYLPGAVVFRLPAGNRPHRAGLAADERVFWAVILSVVWSLAVVLAQAGIGQYSFNRLLGVNLAAVAVLVAIYRGRLRYASEAARLSPTALMPVALVALGLWLYFPPAEYVMGGKDPGTYLNEGIQIAQRGSLVVHDEVVASVPAPLRDLFFPARTEKLDEYYGNRFMGFWIRNPDTGAVIGQFPHLFPASIAIGYGLNGLSGARQAVAVWATLGLVAVYFAGSRIFGRVPAGAAAGLLAINVAQVWFARYPNSEMVMQALIFAAFLAFARASEGSRGFFGTTAGALLGMMLFLRYEIVLAYGAFLTAATLAPALRQRLGYAFPVTLAVVGLAGLWYLAVPMRGYSAYPLGVTRELGGWWIAGGGLIAIGLARKVLRIRKVAAFVLGFLPPVLAVTLVALAVYAYFFREQTGRLALGDAIAFRSFAWYVSPPVLAVAVAGMGVLTLKRFWRDPAFFLTFAIFGVFFFYKTRIYPEHFWTARRFLAVTLPGTILLVTALAHELVGRARVSRVMGTRGRAPSASQGRQRVAAVLGAVLTAAAVSPVAVVFWRGSAPIRPHVEYAGLIPHLEQLAAMVGDRDLLVVESGNAGSDLHVLALPLAYVYARHVLVLNSPVPLKRDLESFVAWARGRYDRVLFLGGGGTDLLTKGLRAEPVASDAFKIPEYDSPANAFPSGARRKDFEFGLYRLDPVTAAPAGPITLTIGALDDLNVVRFLAKETHADTGTPFRWTTSQSFVLLLGMAADARHVTVWMSTGGRPARAAPATVEVSLELPPDERVIGTVTPADDTRPYSFDIPADVAAKAAASPDPIRLRLRVPTWNPGTLLGAPDTRDLGVQVTRVEVR